MDPETRRSGGVYYTPECVVDYMVRSTLGKQVEGRSPGQLAGRGRGQPLRVLDPACGAGAFLCGACRFLFNRCLQWYRRHDPESWPQAVHRDLHSGRWRLRPAEKKRLLRTHIYGVDIDPHAVEAAKKSLVREICKGEQSLGNVAQLSRFCGRLLSLLAGNVKCGNALLGPENYAGRHVGGAAERPRRNGFDWNAEFPAAMAAGGFDCILGNPPYRRERHYRRLMEEIIHTPWGRKYHAPRMDLWYFFLHRGLELLRPAGVLSYIVSAYWTAGTGAEKLIAALRESAHIDELFLLGKLKVFPKVTGQHMILRITKQDSARPTTIKWAASDPPQTAEPFLTGRRAPRIFAKTAEQLFLDGKMDLLPPADRLLAKLERWKPLRELGDVRQGIAENPATISRRTAQKFDHRYPAGEGVFVLRPEEVRKLSLRPSERALLRPYYTPADLGRYFLAARPSRYLIYSTPATCPEIRDYPALHRHLKRFRPVMEQRRETRKGSNHWWHLHWPRDEILWKSPKILALQMAKRPAFVPAARPASVPFSVNVFLPSPSTREHLHYITALLNSRPMWEWFRHHAKRRGVGLEINGHVLRRAPIRTIDFSNPADAARHHKITVLVEKLSAFQARSAIAESPRQKAMLQRQADAVDAEIDRLVYELYELTGEDIFIAEGGRGDY